MKVIFGMTMAVAVGSAVSANIVNMFSDFLDTFHAALGM